MRTAEADYLIVGSGATGMAVADVLLHETEATIAVVDRRYAPGGHWNDAYPFVRLHQPSAYYGVNSRELGGDSQEHTSLNRGTSERASSAEILAYYEALMREFMRSERFRYFPMSDYEGDLRGSHRIVSRVTGEAVEVRVWRRTVDTTYLGTEVPATHRPKFEVEPGARLIPPGGLMHLTRPPAHYAVIGGGKTGLDTCIWLLESGIAAEEITWIVPRDGWWQNRANVQPGEEFFERTFTSFAVQAEIAARAHTVEELFRDLEETGQLLRIDPTVPPRMYHGAIASVGEIEALRGIRDVVRKGRVRRIGEGSVVLDGGAMPAGPDWLYVDCTARGVATRPALHVFDGPTMTPQMVRGLQPTFSAAFIAHVEAVLEDEAEKNLVCTPIPMTDHPLDWLSSMATNLANQDRWRHDPRLTGWITASRLDRFSALARGVAPDDAARRALLHRYGVAAATAVPNLRRLLAEARPSDNV